MCDWNRMCPYKVIWVKILLRFEISIWKRWEIDRFSSISNYYNLFWHGLDPMNWVSTPQSTVSEGSCKVCKVLCTIMQYMSLNTTWFRLKATKTKFEGVEMNVLCIKYFKTCSKIFSVIGGHITQWFFFIWAFHFLKQPPILSFNVDTWQAVFFFHICDVKILANFAP
jgi:hypothetical protein